MLTSIGSFGTVYKGNAKGLTGKIVIKDLEIQNQKSVEDWKKEITVMRYIEWR